MKVSDVVKLTGVTVRTLHYCTTANKRVQIAEHLRYLPMGYFNDNSLGAITSVTTNTMDNLSGAELTPERHDLRAEDIRFSYGEKQIVNGITLDIPERTTTAIVGPSGGGKTTLCHLLSRFWDVDGGRVMLGGHDVREYDMDSLMRNFSFVFQNVYLFHDTVANNIRFGQPDAPMETVVAAAKKARCHDFIMKLPQGYDTVIGEAGGSLSGGERQRLSIARVRLCLLILQHQKHQIGTGPRQIYGILFDGAWLWEEYINSLIKETFYHPMNKNGAGAQRLFDRNVGLIYPDFISRNSETRIVADAKYKPIDNIGNRDYLQVLAYMFRFDTKAGYYLYPEAEGSDDLKLWLNRGSTYEKNVMPRNDISVTKHGLKIPVDALNYAEFFARMKTCEQEFKSALIF